MTTLSLEAIINHAGDFPAMVSATSDQFLSEMPMLVPSQQGFCFSSHLPSAINQSTVSEQAGAVVGPCSNLLLSELLGHEKMQGGEKAKLTSLLGYPSLIGGESDDLASHSAATTTVSLSLPVENNHVHGVPVGLVTNSPEGKSTLFINDVAFQFPSGPLNIREAFGDDVVLINSAGELVVTDQWGITLQSLQHGVFYYLI